MKGAYVMKKLCKIIAAILLLSIISLQAHAKQMMGSNFTGDVMIDEVYLEEQRLVLNGQSYKLAFKLKIFNKEGHLLSRNMLQPGSMISYQLSNSAKEETIDAIIINSSLEQMVD